MSSKFKKQRAAESSDSIGSAVIGLNLSSADDAVPDVNIGENLRRASAISYLRRHLVKIGIAAIVLLLGIGILARNGMLPNTDPISGKRTGFFGKELPKNASSSWNPFAAPLPTATPQLSRELVYAGSRLVSQVDSNASETPPADLAVWRTGTNAAWYVRGSDGSLVDSASWGTTSDEPSPGDFDGDGKTDFCVFRPSNGTWYVIYSASGGTAGFGFGTSGDEPVVGDYDGDGKSDPAVYRSSNGTWYWLKSSTGYADMGYVQFGLSTDIAAPADYDGDGKTDLTVWRNSNTTFYTTRSSDSTLQTATFGTSGDNPVSADYDGDGKANYALRSGASWVILNAAMSSTSTTTPSGDASGDIPVQNDYDGDGKVDIAVWRPSNGDWYIRKSSASGTLRQDHWGQSGDTPVPAYWRR